MNREVFSFFRNTDKTTLSTFGLVELNKLKELHELEKSEPAYRELVSAREALDSVSNEWFAVSMTVSQMKRAGLTNSQLFEQFAEHCKDLFGLKMKLEDRLKEAEKAWQKREEEKNANK